jgi:hypothetical protein
MKRFLRYFLVPFTGIFFIIPLSVFSQPSQPTGKILFLTFTMKHNGDIVLKSSKVVPGSLKKRKTNDEGEFLYEVMNKQNRSVERGAFHSPLIRHFDAPDPIHPTLLNGGIVIDTMAQFVVRVPYESNLSVVSFFTKTDTNAAGLGKSVQNAASPKWTLLKSIVIPQQEIVQ